MSMMKTETQIKTLREKVQLTVDMSVANGCPKVPQTQLECHAYELGRLSALKWVAPDPPKEPDANA